MEVTKIIYKDEEFEILNFDFVGEDNSISGGAAVFTDDLFMKHIWDEKTQDYQDEDAACFDQSMYGSIELPDGTTMSELIKTEEGKEILEDAVKLIDPYIIKIM